jgi:hypothetical protein
MASEEQSRPETSEELPEAGREELPEPSEAEAEAEAESEAALARLEDRIGAFTSFTIAADFLELREIFVGSFERMKEEDWARRSERRATGWTRRQTLAHLDAVASAYNQAIVAALAGQPVEVAGLSERSELKAFNQAAIDARAEIALDDLIASFLESLSVAARLAAPLAVEDMIRPVPLPHLSGVPTIAELFGASLAHAGIVHGAQVVVARSRPIWIYFQPGMMRRQLTRLIHLLGLSYWPERGGDLHATLAVNIAGQGGGSWLIRVSPEGGQGKIGRARTNDVTFSFASADLFCRLMTFQTAPWRPLLMRRLRIDGKLSLARRLPNLFMPT